MKTSFKATAQRALAGIVCGFGLIAASAQTVASRAQSPACVVTVACTATLTGPALHHHHALGNALRIGMAGPRFEVIQKGASRNP